MQLLCRGMQECGKTTNSMVHAHDVICCMRHQEQILAKFQPMLISWCWLHLQARFPQFQIPAGKDSQEAELPEKIDNTKVSHDSKAEVNYHSCEAQDKPVWKVLTYVVLT